MEKIKVAIIGAGNISNTRHIPALKKLRDVQISGVVGVNKKKIDRTIAKYGVVNRLKLNTGDYVGQLSKCDWFASVDAVVIGAPPRDHFSLVEAALLNGKHVLVEKPMTMNIEEADKLIALSKKMKKVFCVMHNFQFASGIQKLERVIASGKLGAVTSFMEFQLTNKNRRLPEWYNDLPLGLFYDEAPHFMYLLERLGGKLKIQNAFAQLSDEKNNNTPVMLSVALKAGQYPATIFLNFDAPVCEWYFVVSGSKKIAYYDLFKDILVIIPTDNEHYASDILKSSWRMTYQYWAGFMKNGLRMLTGNLLYGHEIVMRKFIDSIIVGKCVDSNIDCVSGKATVQYMGSIVDAVSKSASRKGE